MDRVTDVKPLKRGFQLTVNNREILRLSGADYRELPLCEGESFDLEAYKNKLLLRQYPEALNRAVGLLAIRARSRQEVERKLTDSGYLPDTVEMVLFKLQKEKLLDDEAFALAWVHSRMGRGLGKARIRQELYQKGIAGDVAQAALMTLYAEDIDSQALALAEKLLRRVAGQSAPDAKRKVLAAMLRRGYGYGEASRALSAALAQVQDE